MSASMKYILRTPEGNEYGPIDQETMVNWAEAGRISHDCEVRNTLMKKWTKAEKVAFLTGIIDKQKTPHESGASVGAKLNQLINPKMDDKSMRSLNKSGQFVYAPGTTTMRFGAWVIDTCILGLVALGLMFFANGLIEQHTSKELVYILFTLGTLGSVLIYYTVAIGLMAQTPGQWFFGLMIVGKDGGPVLLGRAFIFTIGYLLFSWSTLVLTFCLPSKRSLQDFISGTRVVKITTK